MIDGLSRLRSIFFLSILVLLLNLLAAPLGVHWTGQAEGARARQETLLAQLEQLFSALKDGETGQRGFVISGRDDFLAPLYQGYAEVDRLSRDLRVENAHDDVLIDALKAITREVEEQRDYFQEVISVRRERGLADAVAIVGSGRGKVIMDGLRRQMGDLIAQVAGRLTAIKQDILWRERVSYAGLVVIAIIDLALMVLLFVLSFRIIRASVAAKQEQQLLGDRLSSGMTQLERRNREISLLSQMAGALHSSHRFDECHEIIRRFALQLFPDSDGCMYLYHPSHDVLECASHWGDWNTASDLMERDACWALRRGQSHAVGDPSRDLVCAHMESGPLRPEGYLCVPLMAQGEPLGVLTLIGGHDRLQELAEAFAEQVSLGVSNLSLRDSLRQQSVRDALTGLYNRRFLDETLRLELLRAGRKQVEVAVVMLDADHFKRFNDSFGHEAGDLVLRELAGELRKQVRASDLACRFGGEEFALVLPEISEQDAIARCESLRLAVSKLQLRYGGHALGAVTISLGLAMYPRDGSTSDGILQAADQALYAAKREGRNRVCRAFDQMPDVKS